MIRWDPLRRTARIPFVVITCCLVLAALGQNKPANKPDDKPPAAPKAGANNEFHKEKSGKGLVVYTIKICEGTEQTLKLTVNGMPKPGKFNKEAESYETKGGSSTATPDDGTGSITIKAGDLGYSEWSFEFAPDVKDGGYGKIVIKIWVIKCPKAKPDAIPHVPPPTWPNDGGGGDKKDSKKDGPVPDTGGGKTRERDPIKPGGSPGLRIEDFDTPKGIIHVNLPDGLEAGDTFSGTVVTEPKGKNDREIAQNEGELNSYVVDVENKRTTVGDKVGQWIVPAAAVAIAVVLFDGHHNEVARHELPVTHPSDTPVTTIPHAPVISDFQVPTSGQTGQPLKITGPFDGNLTTSTVRVGGQSAQILAESPRGVIAVMPKTPTGATDIEVEKYGIVAKLAFRNIGVRLTAAHTPLLAGEQTILTVRVVGVDRPTPVTVTNASPGVVRMAGGEVQKLDVDPAGGATIGLTGVSRGPFRITAHLNMPPDTPAPANPGTTTPPTDMPMPPGLTPEETKMTPEEREKKAKELEDQASKNDKTADDYAESARRAAKSIARMTDQLSKTTSKFDHEYLPKEIESDKEWLARSKKREEMFRRWAKEEREKAKALRAGPTP